MRRLIRKIMQLILPTTALGLLIFAVWAATNQPERVMTDPPLPPSHAPFLNRIAGMGIVEPKSELIAVGTHLPGIITQVHVKVGQKVKMGDPLFTLDDRQVNADLVAARAALESAQVQLADAVQQRDRYERLKNNRVASQEEFDRRWFAAEIARTHLREAQAQIGVLQTELARLTVRAPLNSTVLRINARLGEYAPVGMLADPLLIVGATDVLHVRVEVDETDALRLDPSAKAIASVRGQSDVQVALQFVRQEPLLQPKRTLSGSGAERVDTRVLEVLYAFDPAQSPVFIGQQLDVYIEAADLLNRSIP